MVSLAQPPLHTVPLFMHPAAEGGREQAPPLFTHPAAAEFGVSRDPGRWGCLLPAPAPADGAPPAPAPLVYALRPPWVPNDVLGSHKALEHNKALLSAQAGAAKPAAAEAGAPSAAP